MLPIQRMNRMSSDEMCMKAMGQYESEDRKDITVAEFSKLLDGKYCFVQGFFFPG